MKYLKSYEGVKNSFEKVSERWKLADKVESFDKNRLQVLSNYDAKLRKTTKGRLDPFKLELIDYVSVKLSEHILLVYQLPDEYYFVLVSHNNDERYLQNVYKCDQIEGVIDLINFLNHKK